MESVSLLSLAAPPQRNTEPPQEVKATDGNAPAGSAPGSQPRQSPKQAYYWIVTHYREGDSVSGPFRLENPPRTFDDNNPVTISWIGSDQAVSYDVYRTHNEDWPAANCNCLVARDLIGTSTKDTRPDERLRAATFPALDQERVVYRPLSRPLGSMRAFHREMLDCIRREEMCRTPPSLSTVAVDGP